MRKRKLVPGVGYDHQKRPHSDEASQQASEQPQPVNGHQQANSGHTVQDGNAPDDNGQQQAEQSSTDTVRRDTLGRRIVDNHGRPSTYDEKVAERICELVSEGQSMRAICGKNGMPPRKTVLGWVRMYADFSAQFARAIQARAEWRKDEIDELIDKVLGDEVAPNAGRMAFDAHKWLMGKENPARYGDKVTNIHEGGDKPIQTQNMSLINLTDRLQAMAQQQDKTEPDQGDT